MKRKMCLVLGMLVLLMPALASAAQKVFFDTDKSDLSFIEKEKIITF